MENTSLMGAIYTRQLHIIAYLLEKQVVSLDDKNLWGYTPLIVASIENYAEIVEALLNRGVNIEDVDREDMTALLWAAMKGNIETLQMLISRGANVHAKDMFSNTALLLAASEGQVNTVRYLLSKGYASITESNDDDVTALLCACRVTLPSTSLLWHLEVIKQTITQHFFPPHPLQAGDLETVQYLISQGATVAESDCTGQTPLITAAASGSIQVIDYLLQKGSNVVHAQHV